jgi:Na+/H+ antiporter NhaA
MSNEPKNLLHAFLERVQGPFSAFIHAQRTSSIFLLAFVVGHAHIRCSPHRCRRDHQYVKDVHDLAERAGTPLRRWEDAITLPVSLFSLPLFALANAGIGFTMSTFIAALGFDTQPEVLQHAKTAILMASVISATLGMVYIRMVSVAGSSGKGDELA